MSIIRVLDDSTINKIAAGEVVERPASVVKELVENSIDAGATKISVEIKDGGANLIRIIDNGKGIPREHVEVAFLRHATSKIVSSDDLDGVLSLGFRGEALASIASVAFVDITTKTDDDTTAVCLNIEGGQVTKRRDAGGITGTDITVKSLFFNTPARRKFLKSTRAESGAVSDIISFVALSRPDIAVKYTSNDVVVFQTNGNGDIRAAIMQIFGMEYAKNLIEVDFQENDVELTGYLGKPEIARGNRTYEMMFINGRYVRSTALSRAVENAYRSLAPGRFPFFVLHLKIDPSSIDVNVHPTKLEVRFSNEAEVCRMIEQGIREALMDESLIPDVQFERKQTFAEVTKTPITNYSEILLNFNKPKEQPIEPVIYGQRKTEEFAPVGIAQEPYIPPVIEEIKIGDNVGGNVYSAPLTTPPPTEAPLRGGELSTANTSDTGESRAAFLDDYTIVGQVFTTYWIVAQGDSMFMIDQHAAHERILYEEMLYGTCNAENTQMLLTPLTFTLTESEDAVFEAHSGCFTQLGFEIEPFGVRTYAVRSVPQALNQKVDSGFFVEVLGKLADYSALLDGTPFIPEAQLQQIAMHSCKAAIKANDKQDKQECHELIAKLQKLQDPFTCPHGRPTIIEITQSEIERKFKRT